MTTKLLALVMSAVADHVTPGSRDRHLNTARCRPSHTLPTDEGEWTMAAADATVSQTLSSHVGCQLAVASSSAPSHTLESAERPYNLHARLPMVLVGPDPCPRWSRTVLGQDFISDLLKFCQKCVMPVGHASAIRQTHLRCHMHS